MFDWRRWLWKVDKSILFGVFFLHLLGCLAILKISFVMGMSFNRVHGAIFLAIKHGLACVLSWVLICFFSWIDRERSVKIGLYLFVIFFIVTGITAFVGPKINGVRRWISMGGFSLQPSEFLKNLICIPTAIFLVEDRLWQTYGLVAVSIGLCLIQPDLGMSFLVAVSPLVQIAYNGKALKSFFIFIAVAFGTGVVALIFKAKYAIKRLTIFFGKEHGFQIQQSLQTIADSGFMGGDIETYVPDSHCDFMFAEICTIFGLLVAMLVILFPFFVFFRFMKEKLEKKYELIGLGISVQFGVQTYYHILSNLGMVPTKGTTLPFISYGGTSLLAHAVSFGIILCLLKKEVKLKTNTV